MLIKFIMEIEPVYNFDKYVDELNGRGLKDILDLQQAAYKNIYQDKIGRLLI